MTVATTVAKLEACSSRIVRRFQHRSRRRRHVSSSMSRPRFQGSRPSPRVCVVAGDTKTIRNALDIAGGEDGRHTAHEIDMLAHGRARLAVIAESNFGQRW